MYTDNRSNTLFTPTAASFMFAEAAALTLSTIKLLTIVWADTFTTAHRTLIFATTMYAFL